ncbi:16563_t:CDS:2 [Acaulospora morrowiae]|uniref:16563_t:CDS:1 n=1 Tax=Acaulospora morrowiae TaxID=94023 RepID=A0A9N9BA07_9GLOM|nr:16563_t:CDS:2 [Acaulospora morrowiae]
MSHNKEIADVLYSDLIKICSSSEVNGQPINLFDLNKNGKLVPMPQATHCMKITIAEIVRQLGQKTIRAPDISFISKSGQPFTPMFIVEVGNITIISMFKELDNRFKHKYFADRTSVQLNWLYAWEDVEGGDVLPMFILKESSESLSKSDEPVDCPKYGITFQDNYAFMKHFSKKYSSNRHRA